MTGNVNEWCWDRMGYDDDKQALIAESAYSHEPATDPCGPVVGESRVVRGGSWGNAPRDSRLSCRSCGQGGVEPRDSGPALGFRVVRFL